jgi:hypothetical protein
MPDRLYLSLWVRGFEESTMLRHFEQMLGTFPFSRLRPGVATLKIYAIEEVEPPLLEQGYTAGTDFETALAAAGEFPHADCAYILEAWWELWQFGGEWRLAPSRVSLCCFGPGFDNEVGDHLRIEFQSDADFLPQAEAPHSAPRAQSNLKGLLRLVRELEGALPVEKRRLWSETGENFAARLEGAVEEDRGL